MKNVIFLTYQNIKIHILTVQNRAKLLNINNIQNSTAPNVTEKCHFGSSSKISGDDVESPGQTVMTVISSLARDDSDCYKSQ